MSIDRTLEIKKGFTAGIPIVVGFFPVAMAFGLIAKATSVSFLDTFLFSLLVFAGASQFAAVNLLQAGAATAEIVLATFLMNLRHIMMSASLAARISEKGSKWLPLIAFGVTDETFSVASVREEDPSVPFLLALNGISYSSWVLGSVVGYLVGAVLPVSLQLSMGVGLYAMFVALLMPEAKKSLRIAVLSIGSGILNSILTFFNVFPSGWNLVAAIIMMSLVGVLIFKEEGVAVEA